MPLMLLPFLSSGFVPTDSMPAGLAWFAEHQPFTPIIDTLRAWIEGRRRRLRRLVGVGWCVLIAGALLPVGTSAVRPGSGELRADPTCSRSASWRRTPG